MALLRLKSDLIKRTFLAFLRLADVMLRAVLAAAAIVLASAQELPECRHTFPDGNTFDLSGLRKPPMYACPPQGPASDAPCSMRLIHCQSATRRPDSLRYRIVLCCQGDG